MAKPLIHVGLAVSTIGTGQDGLPNNGIHPQYSDIINIAASVGDSYTFNRNVLPESGRYGKSSFWEKHPEEFEKLLVEPSSLPEAISALRGWLRQFQGRLIACSSAVDFWHLMSAFFKVGKDFPFGSNGLIDTASVQMLRLRKRSPQRVSTEITPLSVAKARWQVVTQGEMPRFGEKVARAKKVAAGDGIRRGWGETLDATLRRLREQEMAIAQERRRQRETQRVNPLFAPRDVEDMVGNVITATTAQPLVGWVVEPRYDDGNVEDERQVEAVEEERF